MMHSRSLLLAVGLLVVGLSLLATPIPAAAESAEQKVVTKAKWTFDGMINSAEMGSLGRTIPEAKGVLIFPSVLKGAFIFGAEGGNGVMVVRNQAGGWSYPAFFTIGAASFGFQVGGEEKEIVMLLMTDKAVNAMISSEVKLGGDISLSMGPVGVGLEGSTTTAVGADIVAYSLSKGAFVGISLEGAVVHERDSMNGAYYQVKTTARDILLHGNVKNSGADPLRQALANY